MHDIAFAQNLMNQVDDSENVKEIFLEVGDLSGIEADHLKEHLEEASGWKVHALPVKSQVKCECGYSGEAHVDERLHDIVIFSCPSCGNLPEVLEGNEIKIVRIIYK
jgi:Zn finger protein HypA/HybF involved in hydrogenase expression